VKNILDEIHDRITEVSLDTSAEIKMEILARRAPGGIDFRHPLVHRSREVLKALHIEPRVAPSTSELSELIQHRIPAITLGLSSGAQLNLVNEEVMIEPTFNGLAQVIGMLVAMDEGLCDEH
jgi:tripeptide aminopeptidase